jgi:hypothetical protein
MWAFWTYTSIWGSKQTVTQARGRTQPTPRVSGVKMTLQTCLHWASYPTQGLPEEGVTWASWPSAVWVTMKEPQPQVPADGSPHWVQPSWNKGLDCVMPPHRNTVSTCGGTDGCFQNPIILTSISISREGQEIQRPYLPRSPHLKHKALLSPRSPWPSSEGLSRTISPP